MKKSILIAAALLLLALGIGGYLVFQEGLVPVPLADRSALFIPARPDFGEDRARLVAVMPPGPTTEAFLDNQSALTLVTPTGSGGLGGQLITALQRSRHNRRWRLTLVDGWQLQDGSRLDASRCAAALAPQAATLGGTCRVVDAATVDLRFKAPQPDLLAALARWRVPGSGPFRREGSTLVRFEGFTPGRAGVAVVEVRMDPAARESRAWSESLAAARVAWALFPGQVTPEDMAKVRLAPYDELRMKDGTVWFLSRRMRRLRPQIDDWSRTRLFGAWQGAMDLPYDPLGL